LSSHRFTAFLAGSRESFSYWELHPSFVSRLGAGGSDLSSRLLAKEAEKYLGKPIVPVNKPGAAVGTAAIATAKPDGYTIGFGGQTPILFTPLLENVSYHPLRDLTPIPIGSLFFLRKCSKRALIGMWFGAGNERNLVEKQVCHHVTRGTRLF
jgi:hypothetical protein